MRWSKMVLSLVGVMVLLLVTRQIPSSTITQPLCHIKLVPQNWQFDGSATRFSQGSQESQSHPSLYHRAAQ
jgi:hypothetical protein